MSILHKKILTSGALTVVLLLSAGNIALADTTATQRIFPMDCVFNEVNDGTATYTFLTPAACGVLEPAAGSASETAQNNTNANGGSAANFVGNARQNNAQLLQDSSQVTSDEKGAETTQTIQPTAIHNDAATKATSSNRYEKIITFSMVGAIILLFGWHFILARKRRRRD